MASLVPDPALGGVHFVLCDFGRLGQAFVETDPARGAREHVVDDILSGELGQPLRVITLDADGMWRDVSAEVAYAVCLRSRDPPLGFIEPCRPSSAPKPPTGPDWLHEIKYDGFRLMAWRDGDRVRLYTRSGYDWADRYPAIARAVSALKVDSCFIDGEVVVCDEAGRPSFEMLRSRQHDSIAFLQAFDLLALGGEDLRREPLETRKATLASLLRKGPLGIALSQHLEGDGELVFRHACKMGLEGIVSKRRNSSYKSGPTLNWIKSKNPESAAVLREATEDWS